MSVIQENPSSFNYNYNYYNYNPYNYNPYNFIIPIILLQDIYTEKPGTYLHIFDKFLCFYALRVYNVSIFFHHTN